MNNAKGTLRRLLRTIVEFYPVMAPLTLLCILFSAIVNAIPSIFMQNIIAIIEGSWQAGDWAAVSGRIDQRGVDQYCLPAQEAEGAECHGRDPQCAGRRLLHGGCRLTGTAE